MAIEKYITRALILNQYVSGEHDMSIRAYTEEFGVIMILAKSIRKRESKLKAHVRKYHYTTVTLVKGKEIWRLVGAAEIYMTRCKLLPETCKLIERLYRGDSKYGVLFDKVYNILLLSIMRGDIICRSAIYAVILIDLGYIDATIFGVGDIVAYKELTTEDVLLSVAMYKDNINSHIRMALRESML